MHYFVVVHFFGDVHNLYLACVAQFVNDALVVEHDEGLRTPERVLPYAHGSVHMKSISLSDPPFHHRN